MLMIDETLLAIDEAIDDLVLQFISSQHYSRYKAVKDVYKVNSVLQEKIVKLQNDMMHLEEQKRYLNYRPEVRELQKSVLRQKRELTDDSDFADLRQEEVKLQEVLADLSEKIASVVSDDVFVDTGLPLAAHKPHHHSGDQIKERIKDDD